MGRKVDVWDEKLGFKVTPNFKTEKMSDTVKYWTLNRFVRKLWGLFHML